MIVCRSPLRISYLGGSTDYKCFYKNYSGLVIGSAINIYSYAAMRYRPSCMGLGNLIVYSKKEKFINSKEIKNKLFRCIVKKYCNADKHVDLHFFSDVPARTGLGGSSAAACTLIKGFHNINKKSITKKKLAEDAISIERDELSEPGGVQDQIWSSYGGYGCITFSKNGTFKKSLYGISQRFFENIIKSTILIYTNSKRRNSKASVHTGDKQIKHKLNILNITKQGLHAARKENIKEFGQCITESWYEKKCLSPTLTNANIDQIIKDCKSLGSYGCKLIGGGSSGFVMSLCDKKSKSKIKELFGNRVFSIKPDLLGSTIL